MQNKILSPIFCFVVIFLLTFFMRINLFNLLKNKKKKHLKMSKKTEKKQQQKVIEDKTFGLKNKNKSVQV